ncbi:hypothetical protein AVEN_101497-1 [Araneus ventricosus]|uniref:Uncharacterized protein n=1 Tax=Araneus ventricosus TaxID=182803 RepID=A0A4Y2F9L1_ARAVE|nr:hypothetical protein AVEN_101497-1 [Araneus ventricosus]
MIDGLSGAKYFLHFGFNIRLSPDGNASDHTKYTAIATEFGLYEYKRLPFGLKKYKCKFSRLMNLGLAGLNEFQISCYIGSLVIPPRILLHIKRLQMVLIGSSGQFKELNPQNVPFTGNERISYLGHTLSKEGQNFS